MLNRIRRRAGITLLEIMIAMSLMSVVIIAFATVFPSGYRLNFANLNQSKAAGFASGVAEQLSNASAVFLTNPPLYTFGSNIAPALVQDGIIALPNGLLGASTTATNVFWLDSVVVTNKAPTNPFGASDPNPDTTGKVLLQIGCCEITVTVKWNETRRKAPAIVKTVTVTTLANNVMSQ